MKQPYYEAEIKVFNCSFELLVNDVYIRCQYPDTSVWINWPINEAILRSGPATFEFRVLPLKGQATLSPKAQATVNIWVSEARTGNGTPRQSVYKGKTLTFADKQPPAHAVKGSFNATVPYTVEGWQASLDLRAENEGELLRELRAWNQRLLRIYKTSDAAGYTAAFGRRLAELDTVYYFTGEDAGANKPPRFHSRFKDLAGQPDTAYSLVFFAGGKLAGLRLPYKAPGFVFAPEIPDEDSVSITVTVLFHRRAKGQPLEIIR